MLGTERQQHRVLGRRGLQLEVELAAEPLPERQPPGAVDPAPERGVDHELHPAGLVEEALGHDRVLSRQGAEEAAGLCEVFDELVGGSRGTVIPRKRSDRGIFLPRVGMT